MSTIVVSRISASSTQSRMPSSTVLPTSSVKPSVNSEPELVDADQRADADQPDVGGGRDPQAGDDDRHRDRQVDPQEPPAAPVKPIATAAARTSSGTAISASAITRTSSATV